MQNFDVKEAKTKNKWRYKRSNTNSVEQQQQIVKNYQRKCEEQREWIFSVLIGFN